jgi:putative flippase GtrA
MEKGRCRPLDRLTLAFRLKTVWPAAPNLRPMHRLPQTISGQARTLSPTGRQLVRFCVVGASGYAVNLMVYAALLSAGMHYISAATVSFLLAASSNYVWNRHWTFQAKQERVASQGLRALGVSAVSLGANQICLFALVAAGADHLAAQAVAILLVTPFSFVANKVWAFTAGDRRTEVAVQSAGS